MRHLMTSIMAGTFAAALMAGAASAFEFGGRPHCWYSDGWHGDGWYWCGYAQRLGWGVGRYHPTGRLYPSPIGKYL